MCIKLTFLWYGHNLVKFIHRERPMGNRCDSVYLHVARAHPKVLREDRDRDDQDLVEGEACAWFGAGWE